MKNKNNSIKPQSRYTNRKDLCLKLAVWEQYNRRDVYYGDPISFRELQIDHIVPQDLFKKDKENERKEFFDKLGLPDDFPENDLLNYLPSSGSSNRLKSADVTPAVIAWGLNAAQKNKKAWQRPCLILLYPF